ncbi:MAG TPA: tRNA (guanosine(37)-N1)-methyltransferase TrmD [Nitrospiria bacterium]
MLKCDFLTLFPEMIRPVLEQSILKRAREKGLLEAAIHDLREFTRDPHRTADDQPYGGGSGMVMKPGPIFEAVDRIKETGGDLRLILTSPQGRPFDHELAREFAGDGRRLVFICGRYEGIDERVRTGLDLEEISIGDYVLTGGELPALVMVDAAVRWVDGVIGDPRSVEEDSFNQSLLDYPHFTRPAVFRGLAVPDVLSSGDHGAIQHWRRKQALSNTLRKRPDLLQKSVLSPEDRRILADLRQEEFNTRDDER